MTNIFNLLFNICLNICIIDTNGNTGKYSSNLRTIRLVGWEELWTCHIDYNGKVVINLPKEGYLLKMLLD